MFKLVAISNINSHINSPTKVILSSPWSLAWHLQSSRLGSTWTCRWTLQWCPPLRSSSLRPCRCASPKRGWLGGLGPWDWKKNAKKDNRNMDNEKNMSWILLDMSQLVLSWQNYVLPRRVWPFGSRHLWKQWSTDSIYNQAVYRSSSVKGPSPFASASWGSWTWLTLSATAGEISGFFSAERLLRQRGEAEFFVERGPKSRYFCWGLGVEYPRISQSLLNSQTRHGIFDNTAVFIWYFSWKSCRLGTSSWALVWRCDQTSLPPSLSVLFAHWRPRPVFFGRPKSSAVVVPTRGFCFMYFLMLHGKPKTVVANNRSEGPMIKTQLNTIWCRLFSYPDCSASKSV